MNNHRHLCLWGKTALSICPPYIYERSFIWLKLFLALALDALLGLKDLQGKTISVSIANTVTHRKTFCFLIIREKKGKSKKERYVINWTFKI